MDVLPTSIRLPPELKDALQRRASADDRSLASYIIRALKAHVESTPEPKAKSRKS
jgi:predicted DNA-binding protein